MMLVAFLNYLTHEQTLLAQENVVAGDPVESLSIEIPLNDPIFPAGTSLLTTRSIPSGSIPIVSPSKRQHLNQVSGFLDLHGVIGEPSKREFLRSGRRLRVSDQNLLAFNNITNHNGATLNNNAGIGNVFVAGDKRSSENLQLAVIHTLWMREFNRISDAYHDAFPTLNDDDVFNAAAAITAAELQVITYREVLPELLGCASSPTPTSTLRSRTLLRRGILHEFTAAFRTVGHTGVGCVVPLVNSVGVVTELPLGTSLRNIPDRLLNGGFDDVVRGMISYKAADFDRFVVSSLRSLFVPNVISRDLPALDILRYSDVGAPSYQTIRIRLGLPVIASWSDLTTDSEIISGLHSLYGNQFDQISPFAAMMIEDDAPGSQLGQVATLLIKQQYQQLRASDPCHFEFIFNRRWISALKSVRWAGMFLPLFCCVTRLTLLCG